MTTKTEQCCRNCRYAEWKKDGAGRNKYRGSGKCSYPVAFSEMPESAFGGFHGKQFKEYINERKARMWFPTFADNGKECKCFEAKEKKP